MITVGGDSIRTRGWCENPSAGLRSDLPDDLREPNQNPTKRYPRRCERHEYQRGCRVSKDPLNVTLGLKVFARAQNFARFKRSLSIWRTYCLTISSRFYSITTEARSLPGACMNGDRC